MVARRYGVLHSSFPYVLLDSNVGLYNFHVFAWPEFVTWSTAIRLHSAKIQIETSTLSSVGYAELKLQQQAVKDVRIESLITLKLVRNTRKWVTQRVAVVATDNRVYAYDQTYLK